MSKLKSKKSAIAIIAIFLAFTFTLSALFFIIPKEDYSSSEKRYLKELPEISLENFLSGGLTKGLEGDANGGYIPDHFPFRSFFVGVNSYFNLLTGSTADNGYYFAKDGYIVTKPPASNRSESNMSIINRFSASFDEVTLAVVPSPGYIMEDILPLNHIAYPDDTVYGYINENKAPNISSVDMRPALSDAFTKGGELYYHTDHHWTTEGAYLGYLEICKSLGIAPLDKESFTVSSYDNFYGTTYSSSGYFLTKPDTLEIWENEALTDITVRITEGTDTKEYDSMYFLSHLEEDDMYPVFLDGNHALVEIENKNVENDKTLVIVKDSFAHCLTPFLSAHYSKVIMVDLRYYKDPVSTLCTENSDLLFLYGMNNFCTDSNLAYLE